MHKQIGLTLTLLFSLSTLYAMEVREKNINLEITTEGTAGTVVQLSVITLAELQEEYPTIDKFIQQNFSNSEDLFSKEEVEIGIYEQHSSFGFLWLWQTYYKEDRPMTKITIEGTTKEIPGTVSYRVPAFTSWFIYGLGVVYAGTRVYEYFAKKGTVNSFRV